jgi:hypothetical protein
MAPPPDLIWLVLPVDLLVFLLILLVDLLIFWDWIACKLITLFVIFFHAISHLTTDFFSRFLLSRNYKGSNSSPGREEVGRRTLRDYGGFLPPFFIGRGFEKCTRQFLVSVKTITQKPPDTLGILESTSPRRVLHVR